MAGLHTRATELLRDLTDKPDAEWRDGQLDAIGTIVEDRTNALVVQRTGWGKWARLPDLDSAHPGEPYRGSLALPGGFVRPNQNLHEAAIRELAEETRFHSPSISSRSGHT